jgi:mannosyltransferase
MAGDANMRLYYVLLHAWVKIFGETETAVRSLSVIFAAVAAAAVCVLGARLIERKAGFLAGVLFVLNAFVVRFAQTARGYTLLVFLACVSTFLFAALLERRSRNMRIGYVVVSALAVYAHFFAALVLAAHLTVVLIEPESRKMIRAWLIDWLAIGVLCIPAAIAAAGAGTDAIAWIPPLSVFEISSVMHDLAAESWILFALLAAGVICVAFFRDAHMGAARTILLAWLIVPICLAIIVSFVTPVFQSNYLIICVPPLALIASAAIFRVTHRYGQPALILLVMGVSAFQLSRYYSSPSVQDWRRASLHVFQFERPGDAIVFYPEYAHKPFDYYARQFAPSFLPRTDAANSVRTWLMIRGSDARAHPADVTRLQAQLGKAAVAIERSRFQRVDVELYVR